jgi:putative lipoprotein
MRPLSLAAVGGWALAAAVLAGCATRADSPPARPALVTGVITYRLRLALPEDAMIRVSLHHVSEPTARPILIARTTIAARGRQAPIPFAVPYDQGRIDPAASYALEVRIEVDGHPVFVTPRPFPVITRGQPTTGIEILVAPPTRSGEFGNRAQRPQVASAMAAIPPGLSSDETSPGSRPR